MPIDHDENGGVAVWWDCGLDWRRAPAGLWFFHMNATKFKVPSHVSEREEQSKA